MLKALISGLLICALFISVFSLNNEFHSCNCEDDGGFWSIENILEFQRVSDFLIAVAYFSIPIELLYFVSSSNVPFKWVLFQFIAFIVLCGMTHLLNGWTYGPHAVQLTVALTTFKLLTALVSCATAITLVTLIPLLLKVKVRELMLKKKTRELGREVVIIRKQSETGWHVRMLTQEIRKSLDRHTILYTTMVELSKTLDLQNCAVWMPNEIRTEVILTHELRDKKFSNFSTRILPYANPDVRRIKASEEVQLLSPDSALGRASSGGLEDHGPVAAIRMPMLRVSNFKGGTPELIQACYALLVLVLPSGQDRCWTKQDFDIIKVVADQVAVAISHATVLEESQIMREKLAAQNHMLQEAQRDALMASQARQAFQKVMSHGMRKPMHSILGLLSVLKDEELSSEQKLIVDTMMNSGNVLSLLINDVMDDLPKESGRFPSEIMLFGLHALVREVGCFAKCLCLEKGIGFDIQFDEYLPDQVIGDEKRVFQVILHMVGDLVGNNSAAGGGGSLTFRVHSQDETWERNDHRWSPWRSGSSDHGYVYIRFELEFMSNPFLLDGPAITSNSGGPRSHKIVDRDSSFKICQKLVQLMQGKIWVVQNPSGFPQSMALVLGFQLRPSIGITISEPQESTENTHSTFKGLQVLLADADDLNRSVSKRMLEKLGCLVTTVSSGYECVNSIGLGTYYKIVLLDLHLDDLDGFEVAARIRKLGCTTWPLIIAMLANDDEAFWERFKNVGINGAVRKPALLKEMINEFHRVLGDGKQGLH